MSRNKHPEETRSKILEVSRRLFTGQGYEQTTILDIVENLGGLTRGAFYHHFKSKEEVLLALSERVWEESNPLEKIKNRTDLNGLEKIKALLRHSAVDALLDKERMVLSKAALPLLSNPRLLAMQLEGNQELAAQILPFFEEGMADGSIAPQNPKVLAELALLLFNFWLLPSIFPCDEKSATDKLLAIKAATDALGCPVMDEEILAGGKRLITALGATHTSG